MKTLKSLKDQYGSCNSAGQALGVHGHQLARLISKGALYNDKGYIYMPSKTKLNLGGGIAVDCQDCEFEFKTAILESGEKVKCPLCGFKNETNDDFNVNDNN